MARVALVVVPYDSGHRGVRMGGGPQHLLEAGLGRALEEEGHAVRVIEIETTLEPAAEIAVTFDLARSIAAAVAEARAEGAFPLVLAGGCFSAIGTLAGLDPARAGVLWLDAHGDFNTPETTVSGFLDGMALAALTGRCWRGLVASVPGFAPISDQRLLLIGARDLDAPEEAMATALGIQRVAMTELGERGSRAPTLRAKVERIAAMVDHFYIHVDLDVLDPSVARANQYAATGGLDVNAVGQVARMAAATAGISGASLTALDPAFDGDGDVARSAIAIARLLVAAADRPRPTATP
jgi:arginase